MKMDSAGRKRDAERIKRPILMPLGAALVVLLVVSLYGVFWVQKLHINKGVQSHLSGVRNLFQGMQDEEAKLIGILLDEYKDNADFEKAYLAGDRQKLFQAAMPIFQGVRARHQITHFYFLNPDRTCFLRVHNPKRFGDVINRRTLDTASRQGKPAHGIELGPYGTLTLRVVQPWRIGGKLAGYLEMGKEIERITPELKKILGVDLILAVNTRHLDRLKWEEGLKMMGRTGDWDEFPGHVIIDRTMSAIPDRIDYYMRLSHAEKAGLLFKVSMGDREYRGGFVPLKETGGREIGEIIALKDFSEAESSLQLLSLLMVAITFGMGVTLFGFFFVTTNRIEQGLVKSRDTLNAEIAERVKAEKKIKASLKEKELLLREIHHRVKNNMQIVSSLFRLQLRRIDDPKVLEILQDSQSRISAMALVHETLYQPSNLTRVNLRDYIRELSLNLFESYGIDPDIIQLQTDVESLTMGIDTATPCGLIINELVTNALKHAFPDNREGAIRIILKRNGADKDYQLIVSDNGVGMPKSVDIRNTGTLGMQLVVNLTESQLQGEIEVSRDEGTRFVVRFKEAEYRKRI